MINLCRANNNLCHGDAMTVGLCAVPTYRAYMLSDIWHILCVVGVHARARSNHAHMYRHKFLHGLSM